MREKAVHKDAERRRAEHLAALLFNSALRNMARQAIEGMRNSMRPAEHAYVFVDSGPIQQKRRQHQVLTYIFGDEHESTVRESRSQLDKVEEAADKKLRKARIGPRQRLLLKTLVELSYLPDMTSPDMEINPEHLFETLTRRKINRDIAKALEKTGFRWAHIVKRLA